MARSRTNRKYTGYRETHFIYSLHMYIHFVNDKLCAAGLLIGLVFIKGSIKKGRRGYFLRHTRFPNAPCCQQMSHHHGYSSATPGDAVDLGSAPCDRVSVFQTKNLGAAVKHQNYCYAG